MSGRELKLIMKGENGMNSEEMNRMYSPFPKMSMAKKGRKTIHYLQKLKDQGIHIVQHCPSMMGPEEALKRSMEWIGENRSVAPYIHIN